MIVFEHPARLWLLALPVLLTLYELRRRQPGFALPLDHGEQPERRWLGRWVIAASLLPSLLLALGVVLLAHPVRPGQPGQERNLTNVEFVLDVSGSMTSPFGQGSRYDAAMQAVQFFTRQRQGDAFGLTIFGNTVLRWTPLTQDLSAIRSATPFLRPEILPYQFGGTEIGKALRFCRQTLVDRGSGDRLIILLSDGYSADLQDHTARRLGSELAADQIVVYPIHIGDEAVPAVLQDLSGPTGGRVFAASNENALRAVFEHIDRMRPVRLRPTAPRFIDADQPFVLAGAVLAGLYQLSLLGLRWTPW